jgi:hypothetical protein
MSAPTEYPTRRPLKEIVKRYDRVARFYRTFEPLFLIFPPARRDAVAALNMKVGDVVLEIGAGWVSTTSAQSRRRRVNAAPSSRSPSRVTPRYQVVKASGRPPRAG